MRITMTVPALGGFRPNGSTGPKRRRRKIRRRSRVRRRGTNT
jgi:hypothetical protein